jgi:hypothetical protein
LRNLNIDLDLKGFLATPHFNNHTQPFNKWRVSTSSDNAPIYNVIQLNLKKVQQNLQKDYLQVTIILDSRIELIFRIECVMDALIRVLNHKWQHVHASTSSGHASPINFSKAYTYKEDDDDQ